MLKQKRIISLILLFTILFSALNLSNFKVYAASPLSSKTAARLKNSIVLVQGNPNSLVNNSKKLLDSNNKKVIPIVKNNTTFVPIRYVSENLGAKVAWDQKTMTATITMKSKVVKLSVGKTDMLVNKTKVKLAAPSFQNEGRTYIPLRAVTQAFGKKVFYDRGVIIISDVDNIIDSTKEKDMTDEIIKYFTNVDLKELTPRQITELYDDSVVAVLTKNYAGEVIAQGSGFCIGKGLFITNYHVVEDGVTYSIVTNSGDTIEADGIVKYDNSKDMAIIKAAGLNYIKPVNIGSKIMNVKGDYVLTISSPEGLNNTVSNGIISSLRKGDDGVDLIQNTAPITHGSSGSPLFNMYGYVIGINTMGYEGNGNLNFAVAIDHAKAWINDLNSIPLSQVKVLPSSGIVNGDILQLLQDNEKAAEEEDLDAYMATIHPDSPGFEETKAMMQQIFNDYDLSYTIKKVETVSKTDTEAKIRVVTLTKKISGPKFTDNETTAVNNLKLTDSGWKILDTAVEKVINLADGSSVIVSGQGKLYHENGKLAYNGDLKNGIPHGNGKAYDEDGVLFYDGQWTDGRMEGSGKLYYENGKLMYEGQMKNDLPEGTGKVYFANGVLAYAGELKEGKFQGKGKEYHENGKLKYDGEYTADVYNGYGKQYDENGVLIYDGLWKNGNPVVKFDIELGFKPADTLIDPIKPIIYMSDKSGKKLYAVNYETKEFKSISFNLAPENIDYYDGKIYVALLKGGHDSYKFENESGAVAIVDSTTMKLNEQFDIGIDPYDIVVGRDGYLYIPSGSGQWTDIKSYSLASKQEVGKGFIRQQSFAILHPIFDKIYTITTDSSPRDFEAFNISNGSFTGSYDSQYHGDYPMNTNFKISPDGKYIFNGAGTVFTSYDARFTNPGEGANSDIIFKSKLNKPFMDIAFDLEKNMFYTSVAGGYIYKYDYNSFAGTGMLTTKGDAMYLFCRQDKLITVSKTKATEDEGSRYGIEIIELK